MFGLLQRGHWLLAAAGAATWVALLYDHAVRRAGVLTATGVPQPWLYPMLLFAAAFALSFALTERRVAYRAILVVEALATAAIAFLDGGDAQNAALLALVAWQASFSFSARAALGFVIAQTALIAAAISLTRLQWHYCIFLALCFALQLFALAVARLLREEAAKSDAMSALNAELHAAQAELAQTVRASERLRISRDLHDVWGHELTALSLHLELAGHEVEKGDGLASVQRAQGLSRELLAKVRDVVGTLRRQDEVDLRRELAALASGVPRPKVHLALPELVPLPTGEGAATLLLCAREAVTNAVRHSDASNVWLDVAADDGGTRLRVRDDGRGDGAKGAALGNGLRGMRERAEALGGWLGFGGGGEGRHGFSVELWLPRGEPA